MNNTLNITKTQLEEELYELEIEAEIRTDYGGRGMYGETCFGLVHGGSGMLVGAALAIILTQVGEDWTKVLNRARTDNMGYDTITYFPGVKLLVDPDEVDDEEDYED